MKSTTAFIAGAVGLAASVVSANPAPSPAQIEARATSAAASSASGSALPTVTTKGNGESLS